MGDSDGRLWGCGLRAVLPGFRSDVIQLGHRSLPGRSQHRDHRSASPGQSGWANDQCGVRSSSERCPQSLRKGTPGRGQAESRGSPQGFRKSRRGVSTILYRLVRNRPHRRAGRSLGRRRKSSKQAIAAEPDVFASCGCCRAGIARSKVAGTGRPHRSMVEAGPAKLFECLLSPQHWEPHRCCMPVSPRKMRARQCVWTRARRTCARATCWE